jgi:hypothetical protein
LKKKKTRGYNQQQDAEKQLDKLLTKARETARQTPYKGPRTTKIIIIKKLDKPT